MTETLTDPYTAAQRALDAGFSAIANTEEAIRLLDSQCQRNAELMALAEAVLTERNALHAALSGIMYHLQCGVCPSQDKQRAALAALGLPEKKKVQP